MLKNNQFSNLKNPKSILKKFGGQNPEELKNIFFIIVLYIFFLALEKIFFLCGVLVCLLSRE